METSQNSPMPETALPKFPRHRPLNLLLVNNYLYYALKKAWHFVIVFLNIRLVQ